MTDYTPPPMAALQEAGHRSGHNYEVGSPHLTHPSLRGWIQQTLRDLVSEQFAIRDDVRVLEIGAGHGGFSDALLASGAHVTMTEMSQPSADVLSSHYGNNPMARVIYDGAGDAILGLGETFDLVVCASVLHHIPDYVTAVRSWASMTSEGGAFASFADPLWYPRRSRWEMILHRGAYFTWRLGRRDRFEGVRSVMRRVSGRYDEANPRDMVEYHVLRNGCDELALMDLLRTEYQKVDCVRYWSTPSRLLQHLGERFAKPSEFSLVARDHRSLGGQFGTDEGRKDC